MVIFWRRTDIEGLERLELTELASGTRAVSTVICAENGGFRLDHAWELTRDWRAISLQVERVGADGRRTLRLEREGTAWRVNDQRSPDLDGADEPDLSVTPFCNTLPIRRILNGGHPTLTVDVAYVNRSDLTVTRSRQRYDRNDAGNSATPTSESSPDSRPTSTSTSGASCSSINTFRTR
jgi:uncharacterized protein